MHTDLFQALLDRENPRGHPLLSALLYVFCPAAARWWLAGAEPILPFDPVWQAMQDLASGEKLGVHLKRMGLEDLQEEIKLYINQVATARKDHGDILAPELLPSFTGGRLALSRRFGSSNGIKNLGGNWQNLFVYVRAWAFLSQDWRLNMGIPGDASYFLKVEKVALALPEIRIPARLEALVWRLPLGHVTEIRIGLLVSNGEQDLLRFALLRLSSPAGGQPWPTPPQVFALDRSTGQAWHADLPLPDKKVPELVRQISALAKNGPYPPLNAFRQPSLCKECGYRHLCFEKSILTPHALSMI